MGSSAIVLMLAMLTLDAHKPGMAKKMGDLKRSPNSYSEALPGPSQYFQTASTMPLPA